MGDNYTDVYYYELQVSADPQFRTGADAVASVWWNLVHGGVSSPANSWRTPPLEANAAYYWRVRPRVQGDGDTVPWSVTFTFETP